MLINRWNQVKLIILRMWLNSLHQQLLIIYQLLRHHNNSIFFCFDSQIGRRVEDLFEDLRDGHNLISLLEVLSGDHLVS